MSYLVCIHDWTQKHWLILFTNKPYVADELETKEHNNNIMSRRITTTHIHHCVFGGFDSINNLNERSSNPPNALQYTHCITI